MCKVSQGTLRKRELMGLYDTTATVYNRRYRRIQCEKYRYILDHLTGKDDVLDVGCGTGLLINLLSDTVARIIGVDLSIRMLNIAVKETKSKNIKTSLIRADADSLPFRSNIFTKIASVSLLQNMPDPSATISEISRVLAVGGDMAITCLRKKCNLRELKLIIELSSNGLKVSSDWDGREEDVGLIATKPI